MFWFMVLEAFADVQINPKKLFNISSSSPPVLHALQLYWCFHLSWITFDRSFLFPCFIMDPLVCLTSSSGGFPRGPLKKKNPSVLKSQPWWGWQKANCVLSYPSCFGCLSRFQGSDVTAIVWFGPVQHDVALWHHLLFSWTVSGDVRAVPAKIVCVRMDVSGQWFTDRWDFPFFLKYIVLCKWNLGVGHHFHFPMLCLLSVY